MTPIPLTDTSRPPQFPCWVWVEGHNHASNIYKYWSKCYSEGQFILRTHGEDGHIIDYWHPDQPDAPTERPETEGQQIARELRAECNNLPPEQRKQAHYFGMNTINQSSDNRQAESGNRQTNPPSVIQIETLTLADGSKIDAILDIDGVGRLQCRNKELEQELVKARVYADKLAAGLPDGMLPADVENLREANGELAQELFVTKAALEAQADYQRELRADRDRLDWLDAAKCAYFHEGPFCWRINEDSATDGDTIRAAIDAAMQKQEDGK